MNKRRNKKHNYRDKRKNKNRQKNNYRNDEINKKYGQEIKVVSTNVNKDSDSSKKSDNKSIKTEYRKEEYKKDRFSPQPKFKDKRNKTNIRTSSSNKKRHQTYKINLLEKKECSKCNKKIENMSNAIIDDKNDKYYHFDCVLDEIKKENIITPKQRVVYLGSGAFGVIENLTKENPTNFQIKKKIQFIDNN